MARLHEHQGKALLREGGIAVPRGRAAASPRAAREAAAEIGGRVVVKVQAWVTGRKAKGGIVFADGPAAAERAAAQLLGMRFGNFPVAEVLVEETIDIARELFASVTVDDAARAPVLLLGASGGTGIEERAGEIERVPLSPTRGADPARVSAALARLGVGGAEGKRVTDAIVRLVEIARDREARSLEVNPLAVLRDGSVLAADCRVAIDDYAVFRHPDLGIEIARELDHPATPLERAAYRVEEADHRGTFYFAQLPAAGGGRGLVGFHGAGGGGSMMSMDALTNEGFAIANFCDTSGNPSAAKVYRAARIILAQSGLIGYFGSGSGVASQEQYHSAYGLAKAFIETSLPIPAVLRLGGNSEDRAVEILRDACRGLPGTVEGYKKDDTPAFCAKRFAQLVAASTAVAGPLARQVPAFVRSRGALRFPINGGEVVIDHEHADARSARTCVEHSGGTLELDERGLPVPALAAEEIAGKDSELIACEIECRRAGCPIVFVDLAVPGVDE
jgi:succinyl-CoA synthetase beta subunit